MSAIHVNSLFSGLSEVLRVPAGSAPPRDGNKTPPSAKQVDDRLVGGVDRSEDAADAPIDERGGQGSRGDSVTLSRQATDASRDSGSEAEDGSPESSLGSQSASGQPLSEEEQEQIEQLKQRDQEVRRHEAAHKAAAGGFATGGPVFEYQKGPDGKRYAVGGHVSIDTSPVEGDPQATIQKMQVIRQAALAPGDPSSQDRAVAASAARKAQQARQQINEERSEQADSTSEAQEGGVAVSSGVDAQGFALAGDGETTSDLKSSDQLEPSHRLGRAMDVYA